MPSKSVKQHNTMAAAAHNPAFAKKMGIPQGVAREYVSEDEKKAHNRKRVADVMMSHKSRKY